MRWMEGPEVERNTITSPRRGFPIETIFVFSHGKRSPYENLSTRMKSPSTSPGIMDADGMRKGSHSRGRVTLGATPIRRRPESVDQHDRTGHNSRDDKNGREIESHAVYYYPRADPGRLLVLNTNGRRGRARRAFGRGARPRQGCDTQRDCREWRPQSFDRRMPPPSGTACSRSMQAQRCDC